MQEQQKEGVYFNYLHFKDNFQTNELSEKIKRKYLVNSKLISLEKQFSKLIKELSC